MQEVSVIKPNKLIPKQFSETHKNVFELACIFLEKCNTAIQQQYNSEPSSCVSVRFHWKDCMRSYGSMSQDFVQALDYVFYKLENSGWFVTKICQGDDITFELRTVTQNRAAQNVAYKTIVKPLPEVRNKTNAG